MDKETLERLHDEIRDHVKILILLSSHNEDATEVKVKVGDMVIGSMTMMNYHWAEQLKT